MSGPGVLSLVVMAAGLGSRFGGTKQLAEIGPSGEAFLDFAIGDAVDAGVARVVLVVRREIEADVASHVGRHHGDVDVMFVCQDEHGPSRVKPWGTAHAVLAAADEVGGPFLVCNADDYYGRSTFGSLAAGAVAMDADEALLAAFRLDQTLPDAGEVSRGVCVVDDGRLVSVAEHHGIARRGSQISALDPVAELAPDTPVSMNLWAFPEAFMDDLRTGFAGFLDDWGGDEGAEFQLPSVVGASMRAGSLAVGVVSTDEAWIGVTNPEDLEVARRRIGALRGLNDTS